MKNDKRPTTELYQLKDSGTDAVTYIIKTKEIISWHVYSELCGEWFTIPLELVLKTYPVKFYSAQAEVEDLASPETRKEAKADQDIDEDKDEKVTA